MRDSRLERVPIDKVRLAENYPFDAYEDYALNDLIEEIRMNGVITPVLLRVAGDGFEIIDGRARFLAAKEVGEDLIAAVIIDCSDEEIIELIAHTTMIYQRTFHDMRYSQQARIIARYYESLKKQGLRSDLIYRAQHGEDRMYYELLKEVRDEQGKYFGTSWASFGRKFAVYDVSDIVAKKYNLSGRTLARFRWLDKLTDGLIKLFEAGTIGFVAAVELSFIGEVQQ
jgi:ParB family chromosome partitioning protein